MKMRNKARILLLLLCTLGPFGYDGLAASSSNHWTEVPFGYRLPGATKAGLWWCESGWKVMRESPLPKLAARHDAKFVRVAAARGEYEAVQVILRPEADISLLGSNVSPLRNTDGATAPITVRIDEVAYLQVTRPTDKSCQPGWYPDPLPPLKTPPPLRAQQNQPLWLTFHVGHETRAGDYTGELTLQITGETLRVPLTVSVFGFELPRETHLKSAFGLGTQNINRYHRTAKSDDQQLVFEKYLRNFADHRISPYSFFDYAPISVKFVGEGAEKHAQLDFARFDEAAARWLQHFTTFKLPLRGMGGGTFHSRHLGELEGFKEGTPEHERLFRDYLSQIEAHLRSKGWLDKAYTYWFDEPDPKDYEFVVAGMQRLKNAAPGLKRMLTEQPEAELIGNVEIWCGLTPKWTPETVRARREAGEEVWWYICTVPKAPHATLFIDHPAIELRLWPWQSWQYGVSGILVWASRYWTSPTAFPAPKLQDPWTDPMGYVSGYGRAPGHIGYWGNGDGRFLYPSRPHADAATEPILDGPVNSVRWENLRDGMEDYEYFWLLGQAIERSRKRAGETALVRQAQDLLNVPADVSKDLTHFTIDPSSLLAHRERIARMIERFDKTGRESVGSR